ncbi:LysR family transcriptional regulator [Edaphobacter aggregans]|uniref:LysR substrate-binding domain-containing protein n=1 Tax=Edaphobacter aggregans TaxID=570835 RepID=UPI0005590ED9|nr:LysR family transcriptional regulator [Edaphobacter aggregans]
MELRHLRYFTAVVKWKGYREASRRLFVAQPAISQAVSDLEHELGVKLFSRAQRTARLTEEGALFYVEAVRTLEQAEIAMNTARRAAKGEIGRLSIGFLGPATYSFLPELVRRFKALYPGVKLTLQDTIPLQLEQAFDQGTVDVAFTRALTPERSKTYSSHLIYKDPLMAVLPKSRLVKGERVRIADLANDRFVLFYRDGSPALFDAITGLCNEAGFSPKIENEPNVMQTVVSLVEADEGAGIVPASMRYLRADGCRFYRIRPDDVRIDLVMVWKTAEPSVVLKSFIDLVQKHTPNIRKKAELVS